MKALSTMTFGCDLGDRQTQICAIDGVGEVAFSGSVATTPNALRGFFERQPTARVVVEVGTHSPWVSDVLAELGHEVLVANTRQVELISKNHRKSDETDAELLARIGRLEPKLLSPIRHRSARARIDLAVIRSRALLVQQRSAAITHVRGTVKSFGRRIRGGSSTTFTEHARPQLPDELRHALEPVLATIDSLSAQIDTLDATLKTVCRERHPEVEQLEQVPGVGTLTAMTFVLTLEDPRRFRRSRDVGAYLGLVPKRSQSGKGDPQLRIGKTGDVYLRKLLVSCAHYILGPFGPPSDLRSWGLAMCARGGKNAKHRAVVAVARRLGVLLHALWVSGAAYQPVGYQAQPAA